MMSRTLTTREKVWLKMALEELSAKITDNRQGLGHRIADLYATIADAKAITVELKG